MATIQNTTNQSTPINPVNPNFSGVTANGQYANQVTPIQPKSVDTYMSATDIGNTKPVQTPNLPNTQYTPVTPASSDLTNIMAPSAAQTTAEGNYTQSKNDYSAILKQLGQKGADQAAQETAQGIPELNKSLNEINAQIKSLQVQSLQDQEKARQAGTTLGFAGGEAERVARNNNLQLLALNAVAEGIRGNIAVAQSNVDRFLKMKYDPIEAQVKYAKDFIDLNYQDLSRADKKRADEQRILLDERTRKIEKAKEDEKSVFNLATVAGQNGAPASVINAIKDAQTPAEALALAGQYLSKTEYDTVKYSTEDAYGNKTENIAVFNKKTGQFLAGKPPVGTVSDSGLPGTVTTEQNQALVDAINGLKFASVAERKAAIGTIKNMIARDDITGAKEQLKQYAYNSASATQQDILDGKKTAVAQLEKIQEKLNTFVKNGGNTNVFKGLSQSALEKGGFLNDPVLGDIANSIALAIVDYRRAVSGAAFTESEKKTYDAIFPSIGNTPDLNKVKFSSLINKFKTDEEQFYKNKIGSGKWQSIYGVEQPPVDYGALDNDAFLMSIPTAQNQASTPNGINSRLGF